MTCSCLYCAHGFINVGLNYRQSNQHSLLFLPAPRSSDDSRSQSSTIRESIWHSQHHLLKTARPTQTLCLCPFFTIIPTSHGSMDTLNFYPRSRVHLSGQEVTHPSSLPGMSVCVRLPVFVPCILKSPSLSFFLNDSGEDNNEKYFVACHQLETMLPLYPFIVK